MRFLLDTNILIPLEDSSHVLDKSLANFVRLAHAHSHQLVYHPASEDDFFRDSNTERRKQNLVRIKQYTRLDHRLPCPWNSPDTKPNDAIDNEILYALQVEAVHALITEDRGIHDKAKLRGLLHRVYTIQTAEDLLRRLHDTTQVQLPNIREVPLYSLTPLLDAEFFDSLRRDYPAFNIWFREKAREGRMAWTSWEANGELGAICIFAQQEDEMITEEGLRLRGPALKLCTFKVGPSVRGRKIGELFLKTAFRYATANRMENIFIHGSATENNLLFEMLEDFGFYPVGRHPGSESRDVVYIKQHPVFEPAATSEPFEYLKRFFPHFLHGPTIGKFVIPILPRYHRTLFPDYDSPADRQVELFRSVTTVGNGIKLAYLCHAKTKRMNPGDVVLFYRSHDERAITSIGVVENYVTLKDPDNIASRVKRRTVYSMEEIQQMAAKPARVMLFRLVRHFENPLPQVVLERKRILNGPPQSITRISHESFERILDE
jgi:GNAT superfamily N-acetyltransferase